jgi:hypothetical protein
MQRLLSLWSEVDQQVESPLQGNLHGGFGGGCGETQFGCAPCAYPTKRGTPGSEEGVVETIQIGTAPCPYPTSPAPLLRPSPATGHAPDILDVDDPDLGYDADTGP